MPSSPSSPTTLKCGELDVRVDGPVVWIACPCGANMARRVGEDSALASDG
jgi:hypothetical protein